MLTHEIVSSELELSITSHIYWLTVSQNETDYTYSFIDITLLIVMIHDVEIVEANLAI